MKKVLKITCVLLVLAMLMAIPVSAEGSVNTRASDYFTRTETYLYTYVGYQFGIWFDVQAKNYMDELGVSKIIVQKSADEENWTDVKTFLAKNYSIMISYDDSYHAGGVYYTGTPGYYYRAKVQFYAKKGTGSGYFTDYTEPMYLAP